MRITESQLRRIIRQEVRQLNENVPWLPRPTVATSEEIAKKILDRYNDGSDPHYLANLMVSNYSDKEIRAVVSAISKMNRFVALELINELEDILPMASVIR